MNRTIIFALLMVCQFICCLTLAIIAPFFPPYAKEKGIQEDIVGVIFSANPLGAIVASIILGKILTEVPRFEIAAQ
jgi:MFS family permease